METASQPLPVLPLEYAKPTTPLRGRRGWLRAAQIALLVDALDVLVGTLLIVLVDAETVLVTAPILFLLGALLLVASWRLKLILPAMLGLAHCSICLLFTMLVNVRHWSPSEATKPFTIMAGVYLVVVVAPVSAVAFLRMRRMASTMALTAPS
jgi:hypothetical protein